MSTLYKIYHDIAVILDVVSGPDAILSDENRVKRVEWCQQYKDFDWSKCIFANEKEVKLINFKRMEWMMPDNVKHMHQVKNTVTTLYKTM